MSWSRSPATTARQLSRAAATVCGSSDRRSGQRPFELVRLERAEVAVGLDELDLRVRSELGQDLQQLELVDEVVLEPEDDVVRAREQLVASREVRLDRGRLAPSLLGQEARAYASRLGGVEGERPHVQDVVPGEDDPFDRGRTERARGRLAVRDVQRRLRPGSWPRRAR